MHHCRAGLRGIGSPADYGGRITGEVDVDEGREVRRSRTLKGRGQVAGRVDVFSVAAEGLGNAVVPRGQKLTTYKTLVAVLSQLNLETQRFQAASFPTTAMKGMSVSGQRCPYSMTWNPAVPSPRTVTIRASGRASRAAQGERNRSPDRARGAVEDSRRSGDAGLCPLAPLTAVADEYRVSGLHQGMPGLLSATSNEWRGSPCSALMSVQDAGR